LALRDDVLSEISAGRGESALHIAYRLLGQSIPGNIRQREHIVGSDVKAKAESVQDALIDLEAGNGQIKRTKTGIVAV
tara:strand:+ start:1286 stop:1519 length:234 start_codon:yes stop_codon:yes gene_type:complete